MKIRLVISILFLNFFLFGQLNAHHGPEKLQSHFKNFAYLSLTKKLGPFDVNFFKVGKIPNKELTSLNNKKFELLLDDEFNLASIIMRDGEIIFEKYNEQKRINSNFPMLGMSMSKTALAASLGHLFCNGKINSLDDKTSIYSNFLETTPYGDISIRNILQMNSGVSPLGRADNRKFTHKSRGMGDFNGMADVREALNFYIKPERKEASGMNYHASDSLALSVLVEDVAGKSLAEYFYENIYINFGEFNFMTWTSDKNGTTNSFSDLVMTARDWANFGKYIMDQQKTNTCLGKFFNEGIENSIPSGNSNGSRYGFHSWVFNIRGEPTMVLQGHGGQFMVLDISTNTLFLLLSIDENYENGNLFSNIHEIVEKL